MADDRTMTEDYATLSFLAGVFAGRTHAYLGDEFVTRCRQEAWDLTWEKFADWQNEAIEKGVPPELLKVPDDITQRMPAIVKSLIQLQEICDAKGYRVIVR